MGRLHNKLALARVTTLAVALMGVYGTASADTYTWSVEVKDGSKPTFTDDTFVPPSGKNQRGVLSTGTSTVTLDNVAVTTNAGGSWGAHGVEAFGAGSTLNVIGGTISATGKYSNGIQAQDGGVVIGNGVTITTNGEDSYAFGAEAGGGGIVNLTGGSIGVNGVVAAGARAYTGFVGSSLVEKAEKGKLVLDGTAINVSGSGSIGLMAGDTDGAKHGTAGEITYKNGTVTATGAGSVAARVLYGSTLNLENATLTSSAGNGIVADGSGSTVNAINSSISVAGSAAHGVSVYGGGTVTMQGGSIATTGEGASAAFVKDSGTVILSGTSLSSTGATLASNFTQNGQAQTFTLGSGTSVLGNNGELLRVTRGGEDHDTGTVLLNLESGSFAQGNVYDMAGTRRVSVVKSGNAQWAGLVVDGSTQQIASNTPPPSNYTTPEAVVVTGTAPVTFTGTTSMGAFSGASGGSSTFAGPSTIIREVIGAPGSSTTFNGAANIGSVTGGTGSTVAFSGPTTIGGSVGGNDSTFAFSRTGSTSITGSLSLSGSSQVTGGTIDNPVTVGGDATVGAGSILGGNLAVAGALGGSGGTLAPGNSIGRQEYGSSAGFTGNYMVEVNSAGKSDLIVINSGNFDLANIGLTVGQENGNGGYVLNQDYTIVQTPGGQVVNTFNGRPELDSSFAGTLVKLDPVKYGAKDVKISLSVDDSAAKAKRAGLSGNQNATLDGVLSVAGKNTTADAALLSTDTGAALNQLSGEAHASTSSALLAAGGLVQRTLAQRMRGNLGAGMTAGAPTAQAGGAPVAGSMPQSAALPLWAQVVGNWNTLSDDGNAAKVRSDVGGVFVGGDTAVGSGWRVGGALGFTDGRINVDDRSSRTKVRSYTAALYGGNSWAAGKGSVNFLAGAAYTRNNLDSRRSVSLAGGQTLTADYHANSTQLFTELGYALPVGAASVIEPYAGLAWMSQRAQGFSESGGSAALRGSSQTDTVTTFTLGLRGKTMLDLSAGKQVTLFGGLGWRHASGDVTASRNVAFIQGNGASFQVSGAPIAKNAALVDAGVEASVGRNAALGLSYNGQYGNGNTNHVGSLYLKMRF